LRVIQASEQVALVQGLSQPELAVIATVAGSVILPGEVLRAYAAKGDVERAGFTAVGFSIGVQRLISKDLIELREAGSEYEEWELSGDCNHDKRLGMDRAQRRLNFMLRRPAPEPASDPMTLVHPRVPAWSYRG